MAESGRGHRARVLASPCRPDRVCQRSCATVASRPRRSVSRAAGRALILAAVVAGGAAVTLALTAVQGYRRSRRGVLALQWFSRMTLRTMGIAVISRGAPRSGPSLVVANHVSWLDVLVLAAAGPVLPVAKAEVAGWPILGALASRVGTLYVHRDRWRELPGTVEQMADALRRGHRLQVFPEATTRCGSGLNPFHRAAFQAAVDAAVVVSPVALRYLGPDTGEPTPVAAFVGDDDLPASIWRVLRSGSLVVRVDWLPVIPAHVDAGHPARNRARIALRAERAVTTALGQPVVGRADVARPVSTPNRPVSVLVPTPRTPVKRTATEGTTRVA